MTTVERPISRLRRIVARVIGTFTGFRADADVREELETHIELQAAENVRRGMSPDEARRQVLLAGVATLMATIGIVACWIPALRASRIDPAIAMRAEQ